MPLSPKTFRVFVSSTFTDMRAERRILQEKVFPDLKKYCEARGASFQAVDLRWGVNEESQREQRTMEICLTEIARCQSLSPRPNFIVLLGDRYGWQPIPNKIPAIEMADLRPHFTEEEEKLVNRWYLEDTNAIPAEYVLQPWGEEYHDYKNWQPVEDNLRAVLRKASDPNHFSREQRIKYFASATHQEIINGALQPPAGGIDPADHVFVYLRKIEPPPQGDKAGDYLDLLVDGTVDLYAQDQMDKLKEELGGKLPKDHIYGYQAQWQDGVRFAEGVLDVFAEKVYHDLVSVIDQELRKITTSDELTRERQLQTDFAQRLTQFFTGQEEPRRRIGAYLKQGSGKPLAVLGPSGSGKSSLMAQAMKEAVGVFPGVIILRFIGATSASSNHHLLLRQVCEEIAVAYNIALKSGLTGLHSLLKEGLPTYEGVKKLATYEGLREIFPRCLDLATENKPLWIFLDALDQLQFQQFDFLPDTLPRYARIVVSALPELADRLAFAEVYRLPEMTEQDGEALLGQWLDAEGRRLTQEQRREVIGKFQEKGLPLYLRLAFEQARKWHSYDLGKVLPADMDAILAGYFDLLEKEHTKVLVRKVVGYLLSGKYLGLTEAEILGLLVFDLDYWEGFVKGSHPDHREEIKELERLPFVVWSRLFLDLEPYLTEREADGLPIISFYHRQFGEYAGERYLGISAAAKIPPYPPLPKGGIEKEGDLPAKFSGILAGYFETQPLYLDDKEQVPNVRKVVEQTYQETMADEWESLADNSLANFLFLMGKARAAMVERILEDYALACGRMPQEWREKLGLWEAFFRERAHILRRGYDAWPAYKILLQLAVEHADDSPVTLGAERYLVVGRCAWLWLRRERRPEHAGIGPCLAVLEGHTGSVKGALALPDGRILSWSWDKTLRLWDQDGNLQAVLEGHIDHVTGAMLLPDGQILSWSYDKTLRLWDRDIKPLAAPEGHTDFVNGAIAFPDGRILSWSWDNTLGLWDRDGELLAVFEGTKAVKGTLAFSDGRILSWSEEDKTLRLLDKDGRCLEKFLLYDGLLLYSDLGKGNYVRRANCYQTDVGNILLSGMDCSVSLSGHHIWARWHGASRCEARLLQPNGRAVFTQANGQVCVLQLFQGHRPVTLDDLEATTTAEAGSRHTVESPRQITSEPVN